MESPAAGTWTGVIFGDTASVDPTNPGTNGVVPWRVATEQHVPFGSVSPSQLTLAPGQSQTVNVSANDPSSPGDSAGSVVLTPTTGGATSIPVTLRSLVNPYAGGGFSGNLTGGNGRPPGEGQQQYYEFDVRPGVQNIQADVSFANDPSDPVGEYLVSPDGDTVGYGQNSVEGNNGTSLSAYAVDPIPGRWTLIVDFAGAQPGNEISQPYHGDIRFNTARVRAGAVPDSRSSRLRPGQPVTVPGEDHQHGRRAGGLLRRPAARRDRVVDAGSAQPSHRRSAAGRRAAASGWFRPRRRPPGSPRPRACRRCSIPSRDPETRTWRARAAEPGPLVRHDTHRCSMTRRAVRSPRVCGTPSPPSAARSRGRPRRAPRPTRWPSRPRALTRRSRRPPATCGSSP